MVRIINLINNEISLIAVISLVDILGLLVINKRLLQKSTGFGPR